MTRLFQLEPIDLHTGYYNKVAANEFNPPFTPDQLLVYFLVYDNKVTIEDNPTPPIVPTIPQQFSRDEPSYFCMDE